MTKDISNITKRMERLKRLLTIAKHRAKGEIKNLISASLDEFSEIEDPFLSDVDKFLSEKNQPREEEETGGLNQENLEEKLEEETGQEIPEVEETSPQEQLEEKAEEERIFKPSSIEAKLFEIAEEVEKKQKVSKIASSFRAAARNEVKEEEVAELLKTLLLREYLQRDMYETYQYWLLGPEAIGAKEELENHIEEEMGHIEVLQRYLTSLGHIPPLTREDIPECKLELKDILEKDLELEIDAVQRYTDAIAFLELDDKWSSLRVDIENILAEEQEHVHDLERWLAAL